MERQWESAPGHARIPPEASPIWLPSRLSATARHTVCLPGLDIIECRFRNAQCADSLNDLCRHLRIRAGVFHRQKTMVGQKEGTRAHTLLATYDAKIERLAETYRAARKALESLDPSGELSASSINGNWTKRFLSLNKDDIVAPTGDDDIRLPAAGSNKKRKRDEASSSQ
jgi:hypothetical protein